MDSSQWSLQTKEKLFSNFELVFEILAENLKYGTKTKNINKNSEALILIKLQCVSFDLWGKHLNELYKLMETFFFKFGQKTKFFKRIARREHWSNCNVLHINGLVSMRFTN